MDAPTTVRKILEWLKAGYPEGIPPRDYPPVLGVLHRQLTDDEIESIADELALHSVSSGEQPVSAQAIRSMVHDKAFQRCTPEDLRRVSALLAAGGWPLSGDVA